MPTRAQRSLFHSGASHILTVFEYKRYLLDYDCFQPTATLKAYAPYTTLYSRDQLSLFYRQYMT